MILNRGILSQFPFHGTFFTVITTTPDDGDLLGGGSSETVEETILLETECDIQKAAKMFSNGTIMADYKVFFPCEVGAELPIRFNSNFRCTDYAIPVQGRVVGLEYSQLGGCIVDIKMSEV